MDKKTVTSASILDKTIDELVLMVGEASKNLADVRLKKKTGKYQGRRVSLIADDLARIKVVLRQKQLEVKA